MQLPRFVFVASLAATSAGGCGSKSAPMQSVQTPPVKLAQLVGDLDREYSPPQATLNLTQTRVGLVGNDLGFSFEHKGQLYFLFGDTVPATPTTSRPMNADSIAVGAFDITNPPSFDGGLPLTFLLDTDGLYLPVRLDGKTLGTNSLPMTGFSDDVDMHVFFALAGQLSVLGVSEDNGQSFSSVATMPTDKMVNIFPLRQPTASVRGLVAPWTDDTLLIFGRPARPANTTYDPTGDPIYVAAASFDDVGTTANWLFFAGTQNGVPTWLPDASNAVPLFAPNVPSQCNGGFSITELPGLNTWLLLARCDGPHQILYRFASDVMGPWSDERVFFDPVADGGSCKFMHQVGCDSNYTPVIVDPAGVPTWGPSAEAFPYAPYILGPTLRWDAASATVSFDMLMSVWNPYSPMVMHAQVVAADVQ